jgi:hypothetical protein
MNEQKPQARVLAILLERLADDIIQHADDPKRVRELGEELKQIPGAFHEILSGFESAILGFAAGKADVAAAKAALALKSGNGGEKGH